jgi:hypothetical protein|tara:strand:+ start:17 stop:376 length:360 start_codon:yes stop_codon:yes gene_type:complete
MKAYKIVEQHGLHLKTLFHGLDGTRTLPYGRWLTAVKKDVKDGTSKTTYLSGWHVLKSREAAEAYLRAFTQRLDILKIVPVDVRGEVRLKAHSRSEVYLADEMRLHQDIVRYLDEGGEL